MRLPRFAAATALALLLGEAAAQNVVPVEMTAQPLQYMKGGKLDGCGLRVMAFRPVGASRIDVVEASVSMDARVAAFVKAVAYSPGTPQEYSRGPKAVKVTSAWLRGEGSPATPVITKTIVGDDKKSLLYGTDATAAWNVLKAQMDGKRIQLSVRRLGEPNEWVLSGHAKLTPEESQQLHQCVAELLEQWTDADDTEPALPASGEAPEGRV